MRRMERGVTEGQGYQKRDRCRPGSVYSDDVHALLTTLGICFGIQAAFFAVAASLKTDKVVVRMGPNKNHEVKWLYQKSGLPVEITAEFETWRRIRDSDGAEGWVYHSLLSGRRTGMVTAKSKDDLVPVYDTADAKGRMVAQLERGVQGAVKRCNAGWCKISGQGFDGWIQQDRLWGVYPDEKFD